MKPLLGIIVVAGILFGIASYVSVARGAGGPGIPLIPAHLVLMVSIGILFFRIVIPWIIYRAPVNQVAITARSIRASGPPEASMRTGGRVGWLGFRGPLLHVTKYPDGIIVEPLLLTAFRVHVTELVDVGFMSDWRSLGRNRLTIHHRSSQVASPIQLWCTESHAFAVALLSVAGAQPPARLASTG